MQYLLFFSLLTLLQPHVIALPVSTRSIKITCVPRSHGVRDFGPLHRNHTISYIASVPLSVATIVQIETLHVAIPLATATVTKTVEFSTKPPVSTMLLPAPASKPTSAELPSFSEFSSKSTTSRARTLVDGKTIIIAIVGSVAVNTVALILWVLLRRSRRSQGAGDDDRNLVDTTQNEGSERKDALEKQKSNHSDFLKPRDTSLVQLGAQNPLDQTSSTKRQLRFSFPSFWSSASSWSLERTRSRGHEASRRFTIFSLSTPLSPHPTSTSIQRSQPYRPSDDPGANANQLVVTASPIEPQGHTIIVPSPRGLGDEIFMDPRSPRRHSIPLFMENYNSPSLTNHLPRESRSTVITRGESCSVRTSSLIHCVESHMRDEDEPPSRQLSTSVLSLPSVSSEVITPRRHWTFVDVHGPSTAPHGLVNAIDRLPSIESAKSTCTISATHLQKLSADNVAPVISSPVQALAQLHSGHVPFHPRDESSAYSDPTRLYSNNSDNLQSVP